MCSVYFYWTQEEGILISAAYASRSRALVISTISFYSSLQVWMHFNFQNTYKYIFYQSFTHFSFVRVGERGQLVSVCVLFLKLRRNKIRKKNQTREACVLVRSRHRLLHMCLFSLPRVQFIFELDTRVLFSLLVFCLPGNI